jgi:nucleoside-diphosphate-sugar epimerase
METKYICITGGAGFIGSHLAKKLDEQGHNVYVIDYDWKKFDQINHSEIWENISVNLKTTNIDLRSRTKTKEIFQRNKFDEVYMLAADMGGMGFISANHLDILRNNLRINLNTLEACQKIRVPNVLFASSACIYPDYKQQDTFNKGLKESDAYPADPQDAYGWEKLTTEKLCQYYNSDKMKVRTVRFHNIYGPYGTYEGGREKAPAALCRKIALLPKEGGEIEIWGDGEQTRSFCYIDDCITGLEKIMASDYIQPLNLGRDNLISINDLAYIIGSIANKELTLKHIDGPVGVRGRNSDNSLFRSLFNWEPFIPIGVGLQQTYDWINNQIHKK